MGNNFISDILKKPSIFQLEEALDVNYVPPEIIHRDEELQFMASIFSGLVQNPFTKSYKLIVTGDIGIGKTVTVKKFGAMLEEAARAYGLNLAYIHVNCRILRSSYNICLSIVRTFQSKFPKRGYSTADLMNFLFNYLRSNDVYLFLVLDEIHFTLNNDPEILYHLTRFMETDGSRRVLSFIGISRDITPLSKLDRSIASSLQRMVLSFKRYTNSQIFDILKQRAEIAFKERAVQPGVLEMVTRIIESSSDIRYGLNLLWKAGKLAEMLGKASIGPQLIRKANAETMDSYESFVLDYLSRTQKLVLLAVTQTLQATNKSMVSIEDIRGNYIQICGEFGERALKNTQFWEHLKVLERNGLVTTTMQNNGIRGRRLLISVDQISLEVLSDEINRQVRGAND
ncbi:MAG: ORC1-type DNA replication protein [Promethearchaeota archaeon]